MDTVGVNCTVDKRKTTTTVIKEKQQGCSFSLFLLSFSLPFFLSFFLSFFSVVVTGQVEPEYTMYESAELGKDGLMSTTKIIEVDALNHRNAVRDPFVLNNFLADTVRSTSGKRKGPALLIFLGLHLADHRKRSEARSPSPGRGGRNLAPHAQEPSRPVRPLRRYVQQNNNDGGGGGGGDADDKENERRGMRDA